MMFDSIGKFIAVLGNEIFADPLIHGRNHGGITGKSPGYHGADFFRYLGHPGEIGFTFHWAELRGFTRISGFF
jgi:hypothetical protein